MSNKLSKKDSKLLVAKYKRLKEGCIIPEYKTAGSAGCDLATRESILIEAGGLVKIDLGFAIEIPQGYEMQIRSRSGLASQGVIVMNQPATIDSDYRGEIAVLLLNMSGVSVSFAKGDRIAQAVFNKVEQVAWDITDEIKQTKRGEGGFGYTGISDAITSSSEEFAKSLAI